MLSLLIECTILMLKIIYIMYVKQKMTYAQYVSCTEIKIKFLMDNLDSFSTEYERRNAMEILDKCTSLLSVNELSMFRLSTDVIQ